jgi:hypothetical protein
LSTALVSRQQRPDDETPISNMGIDFARSELASVRVRSEIECLTGMARYAHLRDLHPKWFLTRHTSIDTPKWAFTIKMVDCYSDATFIVYLILD